MKHPNPTVRAGRRYAAELWIGIAAYMVILFGTRALLSGVHGPLEIVVALAPVVPVAWILIAAVRLWQHTDEFNKQLILQSLAIAGGVTALIAVTYGFLEGDSLPRPSAWWTYIVFMLSWLVASQVIRLRYR